MEFALGYVVGLFTAGQVTGLEAVGIVFAVFVVAVILYNVFGIE